MLLSLEGQSTVVLRYLQLNERNPRLLACLVLLSVGQAGSAIKLADFPEFLDVDTP